MSIPLHLGIRAHDFEQIPLHELILKLQKYEFPHIQFAVKKSFPESVRSLSAISPGTAAYYGDAFRKGGIRIAVIGCYVNIVDPDPHKQAEALADFSTHLRLARDFGASLVGTETGSVGQGYTPDNFTEASFQKVVESVKVMVAEAERFGVTVGIEAGLNHPLHTASLAQRLLDLVPSNNLQIILDCANLMHPDHYIEQEATIAEALDLLGNRIAVIHLKDFVMKKHEISASPYSRYFREYSGGISAGKHIILEENL